MEKGASLESEQNAPDSQHHADKPATQMRLGVCEVRSVNYRSNGFVV